VKTHFQKVDAVTVATGPPADKPRTTEQFFAEVEEGARITEAMCPKDTLYFSVALRDAEVVKCTKLII
jgi:hypothetical protein